MFASQNVEVFGPEEQPGVEAGLPQSWLASPSMGLGSCAVVVNTRGPLDSASWFEMWAGAGAVAAMCVRRGMVGISTGQGDFFLFLFGFCGDGARLMNECAAYGVCFAGVLGNIFVIVKGIL